MNLYPSPLDAGMLPEELERFFIRRMAFDAVLRRVVHQPVVLPVSFERVPCDGCGYPTVRGWHYDYCWVCHWEQDPCQNWYKGDPDAPNGGPNGKYSLTDARINFERYGCMFAPDDPWGDYDRAQARKARAQPWIAACEQLRAARTTREIVAAVVRIRGVEGADAVEDGGI